MGADGLDLTGLVFQIISAKDLKAVQLLAFFFANAFAFGTWR